MTTSTEFHFTEYHKIDSIFKRDERGRMQWGTYARPEFEFLANNPWSWTEKVDGTNVRVHAHYSEADDPKLTLNYGGRTDNAQMPVFLMAKLREIFEAPHMYNAFVETFTPDQFIDVIFYGEGYGAKIQKGGGNYIANGVDFVLFDIRVENWWLKREDVEDIAVKLGLDVVPVLGQGTLREACDYVREGFASERWPGVTNAEGLVLRPAIDLFDRGGKRIITKIKHVDWR